MLANSRMSFHALKIQDLILSVRLGCMAEERSNPQEVRITVELRFQNAPKGTQTDSLEDTVCYAKVSELIQRHCDSREFKLVERMGFEIYGLIREFAGPQVDVGICIHKVRPPVPRLIGGTFYRCGDFEL